MSNALQRVLVYHGYHDYQDNNHHQSDNNHKDTHNNHHRYMQQNGQLHG